MSQKSKIISKEIFSLLRKIKEVMKKVDPEIQVKFEIMDTEDYIEQRKRV